MNVITIDSEAFKQFMKELAEIKASLNDRNNQALSIKRIDNVELAKLLKVDKRTLQTYRREGKIAFSQIGPKIYYRMEDIEEFFAKHYNTAFKYKR